MFDRRSGKLTVGILAVASALAVSTVAPVSAQAQFTTEFRGGSSIPAGSIDDIVDGGAFLGLGLGYKVANRLTLRADGDWEMLNDDVAGTVRMPRTYLWHFQGGAELALTNPETSEWLIRARGSAGATVYDTDRLTTGGDDFLQTYFSAGGGLSLGRLVSPSVEVGAFGKMNVVFTDKDDMRELADMSPGFLTPFSKVSTFPLGLYIRWH